MLGRFILSLVVASFAGALSTSVTDRRDFIELAERATVSEEASRPDSKCPLSQAYVDSADLTLLSVCLRYGLTALDAAQRYPGVLPKIFALYGDDSNFQKALDRHGHQIIPIVGHYIENGSTKYQLRQAVEGTARQIWQGQLPKWEGALPRDQIGLMAIYEIA